MIRLAIIAGSIAVLFGVIGTALKQRDNRVVEGERVRVETEARKKNDAAQNARKRVTPDNASRVLDPYYRD